MIETIAGYVAVALALCVVAVLIGGVVAGVGKHYEPPRDLCKHEGCGIVHSMPCEDAVIVGGMPFICERRYNHRDNHEADAGGWVASWTDDHPGRCNPVARDRIVSTIRRKREGAPPFPRAVL